MGRDVRRGRVVEVVEEGRGPKYIACTRVSNREGRTCVSCPVALIRKILTPDPGNLNFENKGFRVKSKFEISSSILPNRRLLSIA